MRSAPQVLTYRTPAGVWRIGSSNCLRWHELPAWRTTESASTQRSAIPTPSAGPSDSSGNWLRARFSMFSTSAPKATGRRPKPTGTRVYPQESCGFIPRLDQPIFAPARGTLHTTPCKRAWIGALRTDSNWRRPIHGRSSSIALARAWATWAFNNRTSKTALLFW